MEFLVKEAHLCADEENAAVRARCPSGIELTAPALAICDREGGMGGKQATGHIRVRIEPSFSVASNAVDNSRRAGNKT